MLPLTAVIPMEMAAPVQIAVLEMTEADGKALTVILTAFVFLHPLEFVSVNV